MTLLVQLFESCNRYQLDVTVKVRFLGQSTGASVFLPICWDVYSTVWASPIDGGPEIIPERKNEILTVLPMNPAARVYPAEFIQTGVSAIDGLNTLVRGQKLPIFSGSGLPHSQLAVQIARQAKVRGTDSKFAVVFAAIGITFEECGATSSSDFKETGAIDRSVVFVNLANDPAVERICNASYGTDRSRISGI